ncbi:MAG: hypothetical protein JKY66_08090 [Spongiibacteraceae bacterium]|nr:hypothetical protein [Spongiibacteraceae bacterium]
MTAPRLRINLAMFLTLLLLLGLLFAMESQPYTGFGMGVNPDSGRVEITQLAPWLAKSGLKLGDQPVLMTASDGFSLKTHPRHFPSSILERRKHYKNKSERFADKALLYRLFSQESVILLMSDGRQIKVNMDQRRPLSAVPVTSWVRLFFGLFSWLVGLLVWVWNPGKRDSICLMLSGLGLFVSTIPSSVYALDMSIMHPVLVWGFSLATGLGNTCFLIFGTCVLLYFPQNINRVSWWNKSILSAVIIYLLLSLFNTWDWQLPLAAQRLYFSDFELYVLIFLSYPVVIFLCLQQWLNSKHDPLARTRANWIILSWLAGPSTFMVFYLLPMSLGEKPLLNRTWAWAAVMSVFWMTLLGVGRFRLFNIESHINTAWHWFLVMLFFFALDVVLVYVIKINSELSTIIVLILVLWVYLPIRQVLYQRLSREKIFQHDSFFNDRVITLLKESLSEHHRDGDVWKNMLEQSFAPISISAVDDTGVSALKNRGQGMLVCANRFSCALYLDYAKKGNRLFTQEDIDWVCTLQLLFERLYDFSNAFLAGQTQERDRIRRDLHDQIGHKLLSLIYAAKDDKARQLAQETMEQLRELIRALRPEPVALENMIAELRQLAEEICFHAGKTLRWNDSTGDTQNKISSHDYLNILNINRELLNNAIRHADAQAITLSLSRDRQQLLIELTDNGNGFDLESVVAGNGLNNIRSRVQELDATVSWKNNQGTQVHLMIPGVF